MERFGYVGIIDGMKSNIKTPEKRQKSFILSYGTEKPLLYSNAKITIGNKTIETNKAIWDTGATITAISSAVSKQIGAEPVESGTTISATDRSDSNIYLATIELPGDIVLHNVEVWDISLDDYAAEVVIGMDIISKGRLVVETVNGIPMFSFSIEQ